MPNRSYIHFHVPADKDNRLSVKQDLCVCVFCMVKIKSNFAVELISLLNQILQNRWIIRVGW